MSPVFLEITVGVGVLAKHADFYVGDGVLDVPFLWKLL